MGTRSTTSFYEIYDDGKEVFLGSLYRQYDGYLSCHGNDLKEYLGNKKIINGITMGSNLNKCFNGMGCLAAAVVARFKIQIGGFYLNPEGDRQAYNYKLYNMGDEIHVEVSHNDGDIIYKGLIDDMPTTED